MTEEEARQFEESPLFEASIQLRRWDELAKETGTPVMDMSILKIKAFNLLVVY